MNTQYFNSSMTSEQMKSAYKKLALKYHPDMNRDKDTTRIMQDINNEFAYWYSRGASSEVKEQKTQEYGYKEYYENYSSEVFIQNLEDCIKFILNNNIDRIDGVIVELCGVFIWVSGIVIKDDQALRDILKAQVFKYSGNKKAWYYTPTSTKWHPATNASLEYIRAKYGSIRIKHATPQLA